MTTVLLTKNAIYADSRATQETKTGEKFIWDDKTKIHYNKNLNYRFASCGYSDFVPIIKKWKKIPKYFFTDHIYPTDDKKLKECCGNILGFLNDKICTVDIKLFARFNNIHLWKNRIRYFSDVGNFEFWVAGSGQDYLCEYADKIGTIPFIFEVNKSAQKVFDYVASKDENSNNIIQVYRGGGSNGLGT